MMAQPTTGFENTGTWTTLAEETDYLQQIASETDVTLSQAGMSAAWSNPIHRVDIGNPAGSTMLIVTLQHGNEQASREGALTLIRELAYTTDPDLVAYLAEHRVVFVPNVNPDGFAYNPPRRQNYYGQDSNRDWFRLDAPETRTTMQVIRDTDPDVLVDAHEYFGTDLGWLGRGGGLAATHTGIASLEQDMFVDMRDHLRGLGYVADEYNHNGAPRAALSLSAGLHHAVGFLSETYAAGEPADRVEVQRMILDRAVHWHRLNAAACSSAGQASRAYALTTSDPYPAQITAAATGLDTIQMLDITGYQLAPGSEIPAHIIDLNEVYVDPSGLVPFNQLARGVLPQILDPQAMDKVADATRVVRTPTPDPEEPSEPLPLPPVGTIVGMQAQVGGRRGPVVAMKYKTGGVVYDLAMHLPRE